MHDVFTRMVMMATFAIVSTGLFAQHTSLSGVIRDNATGEVLVAATIEADTIGTVSDIDGRFTLSLPAGIHTIVVRYVGYESLSRQIRLRPNEPQDLAFFLKESAALLQTATVSSGRYEKPLGEATVSLDVIKPGLIERNNSTSIDEVLEKIPGVNIIDGQANIRGGSGYSYGAGSRVMLLIDDIPALQADAGRPNWDDMPVENIEQIEVIKGAASALYGSSALNGIVNVRTAYAKSEPVTKAAVFGTLYDAPRDHDQQWWRDTSATPFAIGASFAHRQKFGKLDFVSSAYYLYRDEWNQDTWERYGRATLGLRYRFSDRFNIGFNSNLNVGNNSFFFYWKDTETGLYQGNPTSFSKNKRFRFIIDPFVSYFDNKGNRHKFLSRIYSVDNDASNNQGNQSTLLYGEYQFQRKWSSIDLVTTAGILGNTNNVDAELYGNNKFKSSNAAAYLQVEKRFFDALTLSGGVRYEYNTATPPDSIAQLVETLETEESKPIFRLGANYQAGKATYIRASWGQGYRYPTIAEKYISTNVGFQISPNYELESETGWSAELGIKQGFRVGDWEGFADVAAFWSQYQNMMEFAFDISTFSFSSQNVGDTDIKGIDLSVSGRGDLGGLPTTLIAGYTYIDPVFQEFTDAIKNASSVDYNILKYRYKHSWKFDAETQIGNFTIGAAGFYNSFMEAIDFTLEGVVPGLRDYRRANNTGNTVFDLRLGYLFGTGNKVSFLCKNIFNREYPQRPGLLAAPRNFTLRFEKTF